MPGSADDTVADRLLRWARESGDKPAFIFRGAKPGNQRLVLTRAEVYDLSMVFCSKIQDAEIGAGQVVCNTLPNSPERLLVDLGCMMAGAATVHGMLHLADGDDLAKVLARAGCAALVVDPNHQPSVLGILGDRVIVRGDNARSRLVPNLQKVFNVDCGGGCETRPWLEALRQVRPIMPERTAANDIAIIFVLAGTSAFSRLVSKTQQQFILMGEAFNDLTGMGPTDIIYNDRSLGWYNGSCCDYVARGTTRVLVDMTAAPKDPLEFAWQCCAAERCQVCFMLPPAVSVSLARPALLTDKKYRPRTIVTGCMPISKQQAAAVGQLCDELVVVQASAETGILTQQRLYPSDSRHYEDGDFGEPVPGCSLRLMSEKGTEIPPNQMGCPGLVQVKGPQVSCPKNLQMTPDGWLPTGDVAFYNARHHLQAVCRTSKAIIHGPYIIYPGWLEKKLQDFPGVLKVVIVPVPDPKMFQEMCVCIVPHRGELLTDADIRTFCQTLFVDGPLECQQIPRYYLFVHELPMLTGLGIPDRAKTFSMALEQLRLSPAMI